MILFLVLAIFPIVMASPHWLHVLILAFYYAVMALSWDLIMGYTGQFSWGHQSFAAIGGYASVLAIASVQLPVVTGFLFGGVAAIVAGLVLGLICLRLRGFYLCLATWVFGETVYTILIVEQNITGGTRGTFTPYLFPGDQSPIPYYYVGLALVFLTYVTLDKVVSSRQGLYLTAIRDDEDAAEMMGVDTYRWKTFSFVLSAFYAGIAGVFYAHYNGMIAPSIGSSFPEMALIFAMTVMGGLGTLVGPIVGALIVTFASEYLRGVARNLTMLIFALVILAIMRFLRGGLVELSRRIRAEYLPAAGSVK
jgi:branched-chain amino acid transport system permease protein